MNPKVLIEVEKRMKENPGTPSRLSRLQSPRTRGGWLRPSSTWLNPGNGSRLRTERTGTPKKKQRLTKIQRELLNAFEKIIEENACLFCETPIGGWCKNCKNYSPKSKTPK